MNSPNIYIYFSFYKYSLGNCVQFSICMQIFFCFICSIFTLHATAKSKVHRRERAPPPVCGAVLSSTFVYVCSTAAAQKSEIIMQPRPDTSDRRSVYSSLQFLELSRCPHNFNHLVSVKKLEYGHFSS